MGILTSKPNPKKVEIGRCNMAAQGIYNMYGLEDKIFHKIMPPRNKSERTLLEVGLEKVNKEFSKRLKFSSLDNTHSIDEINGIENYPNTHSIDEINGIENDPNTHSINEITGIKNDPITLAKNLVSNGIKNYPIYYDPEVQGNQFILCKENIFELNDNIGKLQDLILLQICCNYITQIPPSIVLLQKLRSLNLSRNQLRSIPSELCGIKSLNHLDLSHNFLTDLPPSIVQFQNLNSLHLENNSFSEIPISISKLKSLKTLIISENKLQDIPLQIIRMPFLLEFDAVCSTFIYKNVFEEKGKIDFLEICSRHLISKTISVYKKIDRPMIKHLLKVDECGFCGGPIFNAYYLVKNTQVFESKAYPVKYKLCRRHFKDQKHIVGALFGRSHHSMPYDILINKNVSVTDIFNSHSHLRKRDKFCKLFSDKMHLHSLSQYNNPSRKKALFRNVDQYAYD
ncbi:hypothetical protein P3W45_000518 [Vairimorpha bombi]|jgi:Leucine-rich repeat (LRR) protein